MRHVTATIHPIIDVQLLQQPIQYAPIASLPDCVGGECVFLGRTRREKHPHHGELRRLRYEAFGGMAERVLRDLAQQAIDRFGCSLVRIHHAICEVPPTQASVLVQVACEHRAEAFEACRFLIDRLKSEAPIWKREEWADGSTWSEGTAVAPHGETQGEGS
jgi:molybdopterin synthase catalytic subunit